MYQLSRALDADPPRIDTERFLKVRCPGSGRADVVAHTGSRSRAVPQTSSRQSHPARACHCAAAAATETLRRRACDLCRAARATVEHASAVIYRLGRRLTCIRPVLRVGELRSASAASQHSQRAACAILSMQCGEKRGGRSGDVKAQMPRSAASVVSDVCLNERTASRSRLRAKCVGTVLRGRCAHERSSAARWSLCGCRRGGGDERRRVGDGAHAPSHRADNALFDLELGEAEEPDDQARGKGASDDGGATALRSPGSDPDSTSPPSHRDRFSPPVRPRRGSRSGSYPDNGPRPSPTKHRGRSFDESPPFSRPSLSPANSCGVWRIETALT